MLEQLFQRAGEFDIVHFHIDYLHFPLSRRQPIAQLTTLHGRLDNPDLLALYRQFPDMPVVSNRRSCFYYRASVVTVSVTRCPLRSTIIFAG